MEASEYKAITSAIVGAFFEEFTKFLVDMDRLSEEKSKVQRENLVSKLADLKEMLK